MSKTLRTLVACGTALAVAGGVAGPAAAKSGGLAHGRSYALDRAYIGKAAEADLAEIATANLALAPASSAGAATTAVATKLVAYHTKHLARLNSLGRAAKLKIPTVPSPTQQWQAGILGLVTGATFDLAWGTSQVANHQEYISASAGEVRDGKSLVVRALAKATLPTLKKDLAAAQALNPTAT